MYRRKRFRAINWAIPVRIMCKFLVLLEEIEKYFY